VLQSIDASSNRAHAGPAGRRAARTAKRGTLASRPSASQPPIVSTRAPITVNGRSYRWPAAPVVVVCIDGCEGAYIDAAVDAGVAPWFARARSHGTSLRVDAVVPTFTNPNNLSIVTGAPPSVHGICGNYFFDRASGREVMMNDPGLLRAETILAAFAAAGASVAVVTAKDKLRALLGHRLRGICFSAERAGEARRAGHGIDAVPELVGMPVPDVYSAALSEFVLAAGVKLLERLRPDVLYLSTTDYVQHKAAPGTPAANDFYAMLDRHLARLDALGAVVAVTADHGMNDKHGADGRPQVIYLQDALNAWLGTAAARVILPITDPYVVHHGALGSFATAYLPAGADLAAVTARIAALPGMEVVLDCEEACRRFELPPDRMGDVIAISRRDTVIGTSAARHDLSGLDAPLRSHGGITEQTVPLLLNRRTGDVSARKRLRNFDAFDVALNHAG